MLEDLIELKGLHSPPTRLWRSGLDLSDSHHGKRRRPTVVGPIQIVGMFYKMCYLDNLKQIPLGTYPAGRRLELPTILS